MTDRGWWSMGRDQRGVRMAVRSKISTLVCMRGVPFKIQRESTPPPTKSSSTNKPPSHSAKNNEASVDSELSLLSVENLPTTGPSNNPYFKKDTPISKANLPFMLLVGRVDGPSYALCKRMIGDAIATEIHGLWGMCYLDIARKGGGYAVGDQWLETIHKRNYAEGIPSTIDRNKQTYTTNYPMNHAALYFGWYASNKNGPLLNPKFRFRRGSIAAHLHSFSASNLRNPNRNWVGPILAHGAAATVGNVYEPYLHLTHHFDIFHDRLLKGYTLVEAAYMACPALSWQNVVLGDPLYRPFLHLNGSGEKYPEDKNYRAIRIANELWKNEPDKLVKKLRTAAAAKANATLYEYLGLRYRFQKQPEVAIAFFKTASTKHHKPSDRLRQWLYTADIYREANNKPLAIATLKKARLKFARIPEVKSVIALLNILDPPPPPPAAKKKASTPAAKKKK